MKKNNLLILAVAALGFAACTNDETTAVNEKLAESNAISFRANVAGNMRDANAAGVKNSLGKCRQNLCQCYSHSFFYTKHVFSV